jgi:hypothetical protein
MTMPTIHTIHPTSHTIHTILMIRLSIQLTRSHDTIPIRNDRKTVRIIRTKLRTSDPIFDAPIPRLESHRLAHQCAL